MCQRVRSVLFFIGVVVIVIASPVWSCGYGKFTIKGDATCRKCPMCLAGKGVNKKCVSSPPYDIDNIPHCVPCIKGKTFSAYPSIAECNHCSHIVPNHQVAVKCDKTHDRVLECKHGYFEDPATHDCDQQCCYCNGQTAHKKKCVKDKMGNRLCAPTRSDGKCDILKTTTTTTTIPPPSPPTTTAKGTPKSESTPSSRPYPITTKLSPTTGNRISTTPRGGTSTTRRRRTTTPIWPPMPSTTLQPIVIALVVVLVLLLVLLLAIFVVRRGRKGRVKTLPVVSYNTSLASTACGSLLPSSRTSRYGSFDEEEHDMERLKTNGVLPTHHEHEYVDIQDIHLMTGRDSIDLELESRESTRESSRKNSQEALLPPEVPNTRRPGHPARAPCAAPNPTPTPFPTSAQNPNATPIPISAPNPTLIPNPIPATNLTSTSVPVPAPPPDAPSTALEWVKQELINEQLAIKQNNAIAKLEKIIEEYRVVVEFYPIVGGSEWGNLIHLAIGENVENCDDGVPVVYYHATNKQIRVNSPVNGNKRFETVINEKPPNKWYRIEITQEKEEEDYYYSVVIDGKTIVRMINNRAEIFRNVIVYASSPRRNAQNGLIRKLDFYIKGIRLSKLKYGHRKELSEKLDPRSDPSKKNWYAIGLYFASSDELFKAHVDKCHGCYYGGGSAPLAMFGTLSMTKPRLTTTEFRQIAERLGKGDVIDYLTKNNISNEYFCQIDEGHKTNIGNLIEKRSENDWQDFADAFGFSCDDIEHFKERKRTPQKWKPTLELIMVLIAHRPEITIEELKTAARYIDRLDICDCLERIAQDIS